MSVVKNAIYKVIRASHPSQLGRNIVVQGGTFYNDAVLRSFVNEIGAQVTRPSISGIMGAFGCALYAKSQGGQESMMVSPKALETFEHVSKSVNCGLCTNHCSLNINTFGGGRRYISGNRCERPLGIKLNENLPNLFKFKYEKLMSYKPVNGPRGKIGLPMTLNMYECLPFWFTLLTKLGFEVVTSPKSSRAMYIKGQYSIPSDTVCYPAKIVHGHIESLLDMGIDTIFYPCMPYNFDEKRSDNHYNCPVVAYYPELIAANVSRLKGVRYLTPYFGLDKPNGFAKKAVEFFGKEFNVPAGEVKVAVKAAYAEYYAHMAAVRAQGERALEYAKENGKRVIVLAGRPYHIDPEINHGIDELISSFGLVIVSEDSIAHLSELPEVQVLNQWTYHARLYSAANFVTNRPDTELIQRQAVYTDKNRRNQQSRSH
jgi:predicted nucleotide-binding protein (sugar kinase/HSP70/actin superfamily)